MSVSLQGALSKGLPLVGCRGIVAGEPGLRGFGHAPRGEDHALRPLKFVQQLQDCWVVWFFV